MKAWRMLFNLISCDIMKIVIKNKQAIDSLAKNIPESVHDELSKVYEGRQLSERLRQIVNPLTPLNTGNLRFSPTIQRMTTPISKNGKHHDVLTYSAINQEQAEDMGDEMEHEWNYAYKMEVVKYSEYTTPGTGPHYMEQGVETLISEGIARDMTANAVRIGIRNGGMK